MTHNLLRLTLCTLLTVALSGGLAAAQAVPGSSAETTIVVQSGDTAYSIARRAGLSVIEFMSLNGLSSSDLKLGQTVMVRAINNHVVQAGETLYSLAHKYGVTVDALQAANTLPEDAVLAVGQNLAIPHAGVTPGTPVASVALIPEPGLSVPGEAAVVPIPAASFGNDWRVNAMSLLGTPYVWGGTARNGTDCSGFVLQVFGPLGVKLPRVSADQARAGIAVDRNHLLPGDLLFFDTVGGGKVTHVGIYLGNDTFVNANSYMGKVTVDHFQGDKYWAPRFTNARRVLPENMMASQP